MLSAKAVANPVPGNSKSHLAVGVNADGLAEQLEEYHEQPGQAAKALPNTGLMRSEPQQKAAKATGARTASAADHPDVIPTAATSKSQDAALPQQHSQDVAATSDHASRSGSGSGSLAPVAEHEHAEQHHYFYPYATKEEASFLETASSFLPGLTAQDALLKGEDLLMGTASIMPEDYPFACLCDDLGKCLKRAPDLVDDLKTECAMRKGTGGGAPRMASLSTALALILAMCLSA
eukprot:TRINITY_DN16143_c0_g1_i1.p1 TRINITY_DN16143_c0_g1~~TRINITY_DN16143_c0_g1_i1.p1  ORF type:complete len:270 (-),score=63.67 TRINITY_DN16143_c0_g1_i1:250-954(-)